MTFLASVFLAVWQSAGVWCECKGIIHDHLATCNALLVCEGRGKAGFGGSQKHSISAQFKDSN
jgi:hypothetical protein